MCTQILLYRLSEAIIAVWDDQSGSTGNHSVIIIKEMLLQQKHYLTTHADLLHLPYTQFDPFLSNKNI